MPGADSRFLPWCPLGLDPLMWSLAASIALTVGVSLLTPPPPRETTERYFFRSG
jgi:hypothetical protein